MAIVMRDLLEPLVGDPTTPRHVAQEGDHVVLALRPAESGQQDRVVRDRLLDERFTSGCCGRGVQYGIRRFRIHVSYVLTRAYEPAPSRPERSRRAPLA